MSKGDRLSSTNDYSKPFMRKSRKSGRSQSNPTFNIKAFRENRTKLFIVVVVVVVIVVVTNASI